MKLKNIQLDDEGMPIQVTVDIPINEVFAIATIFGQLNGYAEEKLNIASNDSTIYDCLVGDLINRFWENGLLEVRPTKVDLADLNAKEPNS